jgi:hypothetical protein
MSFPPPDAVSAEPAFDLDRFLAVIGRVLSRHLGGEGAVELVGSHSGNINRILELRYQGRRLGARVALNRRHFRYEKDIIKEVFAILLLYHAGETLDDKLVRSIVDGVLRSPKGSHVAHTAVRTILHYDWSMEEVPFPFFVFEWVDGHVLWQAPRPEHYEQAGQFLARLHRNRFEHFYEDIFAIRHFPRPWAAHVRAAYTRELAHAEASLPPAVAGRLAAFDLDASSPGQPCLIHNDYSGANILVDGAGALHVIDWDNWVVDCPELDLVKMKYWTSIGQGGRLEHNAALFEAFLDGYRGEADHPVDPGRLAAYERLWLLRTHNFEQSRESAGVVGEAGSWSQVYPPAKHYREILEGL